MTIESRKDDHLRICLDEPVDLGSVRAGMERYRFDHDALPEIDLDDVDTSVRFLGKTLSMPLIIGAMTGGTDTAGLVNERLAVAAEACQVGLALGSQRVMLKNPKTLGSFTVKTHAPNIPLLIGNIGAIQFNYGVGLSELNTLISTCGLDALNMHLNPLQEAIQPEGDVRWRGILAAMRELVAQLDLPVIIKEVGAGIGQTTAKKLRGLGIAAINVAGVGGTSWSYIEGLRGNRSQADLGQVFRSWGVPTAEALADCASVLPQMPLIASGGLRSGIDIAKSIRLGASVCAIAKPFLVAAMESTDAVVEHIEQLKKELRITMFCTGAATLDELKTKRLVAYGPPPRDVA